MEKPTKKILITGEQARFNQLNDWCLTHGFQPTFQPFIRINPVLGLTIPKTDWIFFSSPKGALAYLNHYPICAKKIAALGEGTARALTSFNLTAQFLGEAEDQPATVGEKFESAVTNNETVFFPISQLSKKTVINALTKVQYQTLITYKTETLSQKMSDSFDVILFTSPSNVENYLIENAVEKNTVLIAMGETTATAIRQKIINPKLAHLLESPNERAVISFLEQQ